MLASLIAQLQQSLNILQKQDIQTAAAALRSHPQSNEVPPSLKLNPAIAASSPPSLSVNVGDDCAAIPDGDGYLLFAAEGLSPSFLERDPWFAGWCAITVNIADIAAMGGWPIAVVDTLWSSSIQATQEIWSGMTTAAAAFEVPIVGGHSNCHSPYQALAVAIAGRATHLITSFDAKPGDSLLVVLDLRGEFYRDYPFWNAATQSPPDRLRGDLALLPAIAEAHLCQAGKDISMGGIIGTLAMLMETSGTGARLRLDSLIKPQAVPWEKWLTCFPSFGYLLSAPPETVDAVKSHFESRDISCIEAGIVTADSLIELEYGGDRQLFWNLQTHPLTGFSPSG